MKKKFGFFIVLIGLALLAGTVFLLLASGYLPGKARWAGIVKVAPPQEIPADFKAFGGIIELSSISEGNVSIFGISCRVLSEVRNNLNVCGLVVELQGRIQGLTRVLGITTCLDGSFDDTVIVTAADVTLSGKINAPLIVRAPLVTIDSSAVLAKGIQYTGRLEIKGNPQIKGPTERINPISSPFKTWLLVTVLGLMFLLGIGFVLSSFFVWHLTQTIKFLFEKPGKSALLGGIALLGFPIATVFALLLAVTIIGSTAGGIIVVGYVIGFILPIHYVGTGAARWLLKKISGSREPNLILSMFIGVTILFLLCRIPYFGMLIYGAVVVFGFGAFLGRRIGISKQS